MSATASAVRKMTRRSWRHREESGDFVRQPVRAQSKWPDDPVLKGFSRRVSFRERQLAGEIVQDFFVASRRAERAKTGRDRKAGELQPSDLPIYRRLLDLAWVREEVHDTAAQIGARVGLGESTVHAAKERLRDIGVLDWMHRAVEVDDPGPDEPSIRQTSNLYRLNELPERLLAIVSKKRRDDYRGAAALSRKKAMERAKQARARALERETVIKRRPQSDLVKSEITKSLAAAKASTEGASPVAKEE